MLQRAVGLPALGAKARFYAWEGAPIAETLRLSQEVTDGPL